MIEDLWWMRSRWIQCREIKYTDLNNQVQRAYRFLELEKYIRANVSETILNDYHSPIEC